MRVGDTVRVVSNVRTSTMEMEGRTKLLHRIGHVGVIKVQREYIDPSFTNQVKVMIDGLEYDARDLEVVHVEVVKNEFETGDKVRAFQHKAVSPRWDCK